MVNGDTRTGQPSYDGRKACEELRELADSLGVRKISDVVLAWTLHLCDHMSARWSTP